MDLQLAGKRAIIAGGSRGIGKAVARELALEGADVVIAARGEEALWAAATELSEETGRRVRAVVADTTSDDSVRDLVAEAVRQLGGVDILVNCAATPGGTGGIPRLKDMSKDLFFPDMDVKVLGYIRTAREVAPHMVAQGWGRIINIGGLAVRSSGGNMVTTMRNAAVSALTKNIADELGPQGVNVTVVHPGGVRTEATAANVARRAAAAGITEAEIEQQMANANTIRHLVDASEVAAVVTFLASPRSVAINGDTIAVGGGTPGVMYY